jgi:hypothetical protein
MKYNHDPDLMSPKEAAAYRKANPVDPAKSLRNPKNKPAYAEKPKAKPSP